MGCCKPRTLSPTHSMVSNRREGVILQIPGALIHLVEDSEATELAKGDFAILGITDEDALLATVAKVGPDIQWPLTKDEPVVKLDQLHYLFSLPDKDGGFLNYGLSFAGHESSLASLDLFLKENTCFSAPPQTSSTAAKTYRVNWKDCAPGIEGYNGALAKAIAGGTGEIVKGIFKLSNAYTSQVQKGAEMIQSPSQGSKSGFPHGKNKGDERTEANKKRGGINKALHQVRKLSEMTEKMSESLLNGVITVTGTVGAPLVRSKAGKAFFSMVPGEVLLASLDAVNKVLDAVEVAERKTLAATSSAVAGAVSKRFGESAGEATEDVFTTAGHAVGTAWNIFKIRKAINPSSTLSSSIMRNAVKKKS